MKFSLFSLKAHLETDASLEQIYNALTDIGLEVEEATDYHNRLQDFVVAEILSAERMTRLTNRTHYYCRVFDGEKEFGIACGALNVNEETEGMKVVLAPLGVSMPTNDKIIKRWKLGRKYSDGNICSAAELGIGEDTENVVELPYAQLGKSIALIPGLCTVIEIISPSDPENSLDVRGIAEKLAVSGVGVLKPLEERITKNSSAIEGKAPESDGLPRAVRYRVAPQNYLR